MAVDYSQAVRLSMVEPLHTTQQSITIAGTITDETGDPMPGVSIAIKGSTIGVVSSIDGNYSINVPNEDAVLIFSFIGYINQELVVGNKTVIHITLSIDIRQIDEVVVGYGTAKRHDIVGSITKIGGDELTKAPDRKSVV